MLRVILDNDNDLPPGGPVLAAGMDSAATAIRAELSTQAGEWPFDKADFGMRWRGIVLVKYFDAAATQAWIAATVNRVPDINRVTSTQIAIDTTTGAVARQATITINDVVVDDQQTDLVFTTVL